MTVLTTLLGLLPLAIGDAQVGGSSQGPAYFPMARAIMGGLGFSAIVSLLIVPMFYVWFDDLNLWRRRVFSKGLLPTSSQPSVTRPAELPQTLN
jgi:HAE1 family hydrophobic/amphiphilic exporter-1